MGKDVFKKKIVLEEVQRFLAENKKEIFARIAKRIKKEKIKI